MKTNNYMSTHKSYTKTIITTFGKKKKSLLNTKKHNHD